MVQLHHVAAATDRLGHSVTGCRAGGQVVE
jgi:hypothetical protein